jgi:hypothetical protein
MSHNINPNVPPPNGYVFTDIDGTKIKATSWKALERAVLMYRRQTGGSQDNLMDEILTQVCQAAPAFCRQPRTPEQQTADAGRKKDLRHILIAYLSRIARVAQQGNLTYAQDGTVTHRVNTCVKCPFRVNADVGCQSCLSSMAALKKQGMKSKAVKAPALGACDKLDEDLSISTHINEQGVNRPDLPDFCWRKAK